MREISVIVPTLFFNPFLTYDNPTKVRKTAARSTATGLALFKATDHKERTRLINMIRRLNKLQSVGGWTAIIFLHSIGLIITHDMSEVEFECALAGYLATRPQILNVIKKAWPNYHLLLEQGAGIHFYNTSLILGEENFGKFCNTYPTGTTMILHLLPPTRTINQKLRLQLEILSGWVCQCGNGRPIPVLSTLSSCFYSCLSQRYPLPRLVLTELTAKCPEISFGIAFRHGYRSCGDSGPPHR